MKRFLLISGYILSWILGWIALAYFLNIGLIKSGSYQQGDTAELAVFGISGLIIFAGAISLSSEALNNK